MHIQRFTRFRNEEARPISLAQGDIDNAPDPTMLAPFSVQAI
jgi:hypothetical protein